jgi:hypothetical protein
VPCVWWSRRPCEDRCVTEHTNDPATWTAQYFAQSNPAGAGQGDVAALLRRVAETIDDLGDVDVQDLTFSSAVGDGEDDLTITVYYHAQPRRR